MRKENSRMMRSGRGRYRSLLVMNALLLAFLFVMILIYPIDSIRLYSIQRQNRDSGNRINIYRDQTVDQTFISDRNANAFELHIGANGNNYHGQFQVKLADEAGNILQIWNVDKLDLVSGQQGKNGWLYFKVEDGKIEKDKLYEIEVSAPELEEETAIYVLAGTEKTTNGVGLCKVNNEISEQKLAFSVCQMQFNFFFLGAVIILFLVANCWWFNRKKDVQKIAIWILLGMGSIMLLVMAPSSQPDEILHYDSAYKLSNIMLGVKDNINLAEEGTAGEFQQHYNSNESFEKVIEEIGKGNPITNPNREHLDSSFELNVPMAYFAPALGITTVRLLGGNQTQAYLLARLFNMLSYVLMCTIAIRLIPQKKQLFLIICLIPMSVHLSASASRDVFIIGMSLIFVAYLLKIIYKRETVFWKQILICIGLLGLLAPVKVVYFILGLLILCIPGKQFKNRFDQVCKIAAVFLGTILIVLLSEWNQIIKGLTASDYGGVTDYYHIGFVFDYPLRYLRLILRSAESLSWGYAKGAIGNLLAGLSLPIGEYLVVGYMVILLVTAFIHDQEEEQLSGKQRTGFLLICIVGMFVMIAAFSFKDTLYGSIQVAGIQGRYLIPFVTPLLFGVGNDRISIRLESYKIMYAVWLIEIGFIVYIMSQIYIP